MDKKSESVLNILAELLKQPQDTLSGEEKLADLALWDSLTLLEFITLIDKQFKVTLAPSDIDKAKTIAELVALVK